MKICGITSVDAALQAVESGADFIGFVFARSKRRISKEDAASIARVIPPTVKKVGVFVNEEAETIEDIASAVGLDYIQLHGDETPEFCKQLSLPTIKAFQVKSKKDLDVVSSYPSECFLLDSPAGKYRGGNGETFDWQLAKYSPNLDGKIILAGGLHVGNVQEAIREVNPAGIDVSSGVETDGKKDLAKITAFIQEAKKKEKGDTNGSISTAE